MNNSIFINLILIKNTYKKKKKTLQLKITLNGGVPVVAQQKRIRLGTMMLQVRALALLSGLRIRRCRELWCRLQTWLRSRVAVALA